MYPKRKGILKRLGRIYVYIFFQYIFVEYSDVLKVWSLNLILSSQVSMCWADTPLSLCTCTQTHTHDFWQIWVVWRRGSDWARRKAAVSHSITRVRESKIERKRERSGPEAITCGAGGQKNYAHETKWGPYQGTKQKRVLTRVGSEKSRAPSASVHP